MEKTIKYLENGEYHYATVRSVGDLAELKTNSKETLVEAINELWDGGGNADPSKAPKPEGYDQLVQDVADAVKNQQEISQQWIEWQNEEAQLTEERKQAYLQAMKEMQESIDKAKADAAALDDKTAKLDEQITKTFSDLDTNIQNMHEQLQKEADRMNQELINTKSDLTKVRTDLQNAQLDNGRIHDELTNINGKFEHKVWQTDLDPLKAQIDRAETSVQQTKDELLGKASREDLDTVSNTVSKLDTQLKETAKGVEISVKKDELGGEIAEALINKTNILLGTRRFTTNNWTQRDHVEMCSDPWKGFLVAKQNSPVEGIQQAYDVKAGTTYTFSLFAKMDNLDDSNKPQITLAQNNLDTSLDTKIDVWRKDIDDITSDFKRYDLTFTPSEDCTIYPHVISNSNNPIFVCGYQLEIGKELTPWEPNQEDVGDYVEKSEAQFNVYNDKIQALTEKQRQQGDTQEQLRTEVTQTAEGVKQVSESLKNTNGDITKLRGDLERTADHMKSEYESYTNKAVGQISDSTLNLIRNSSFQNKDEDFAQWQNVSAKANVRQDENGLRWVELTQSGLTTDNPQGLTSNYFNVKQGKVTVAVDIKSGDKATLDNESVLFLELYNDAKKRVDFRFVTLNELGLSKNLLDDHKVHRGLYRLGIDRNDAQYMTVKAHLMRNGDLYFTNFSARLSSIDDGAYEPNPDDINQQILKMNTRIEQDAQHIALKANSADVTRNIKDAVNGIQVGGTNLANKTNQGIANWMCDPGNGETNLTEININGVRGVRFNNTKKTTNWWVAKYALDLNKYEPNTDYVISFDIRASANVAPGGILTIAGGDSGHSYFTDGSFGQQLNANQLTHVSLVKHTNENLDKENYESFYLNQYELGQCDWVDFVNLKIEKGNKGTAWSSAPQDTSDEIKSAKDAAIQVASDQINIHVNELSTSFDDKLNRRVNEVKTASEKFTSDGIEQTVTKITNVKNDVDRLGDKVSNLGGGINLVKETSELEVSGKSYAIKDYNFAEPLEPNTKYTISVEAKVDQTALNHKQFVFIDPYTNGWSWGVQMNCAPANLNYQYYRYTFTTPDASKKVTNISVYLAHPDGANGGDKDNISGIGYFRKLKVEKGEVATPWTPYSQDINKKIDTQTLDSANIDQMKTQGHYFVQNLTGNPIGGWVYVDVTGNNNDRIRQDVYQDNGSKHMYRRGFNGTWSDWEQGAYISDVNNVKTEVTTSVKNLGDRVITQVNSITTKVDNMKIGGRNLLKGTRDFNSKYWYQSGDHTALADNPIDTSTKEIHSWLDWHSFKNNQTIQLDPSKNYMISADIAIYDGDGNGLYVTPYGTVDGQGGNLAGTDVNLAGFPRQVKGEGFRRIYLPVTAHGRALKDFRIEGHGNWNAGSGSVFISKIALYEGNTPLAWSDSSDDFVEAIKEVNTKWDVANGQIQGKVTETQVNNILNGKGYATQSWAQTMFQMKSDSITLQAVRDNITNGIQNQVNDAKSQINSANGRIDETNEKIDKAKIGERNLAVGTNRGRTGWTVSPGNGQSTMDDSWVNDVMGVIFNNTNKSTSWWVVQYPFDMGRLKPNTFYTISFDIQTDIKTNGDGYLAFARGDSSGSPFVNSTSLKIITEPGATTHVVCKAKTKGSIENNGQAFYLNSNSLGQANWVKIFNLMIVEGTQSIAWAAAPEDEDVKQKGVNLLKSTAYWNPADWNHISDNVWYDDNWVDNLGHKAYGHHTAWQGLGQTVYVTPGVYTWSAQIYLNGLDSNDYVYPYMGDSRYNGTVQVQDIRKPMLGVNDQDKWINYSATFYVKNAGNLCVHPELNRDHGTIHIGSQKLEHGMVATPWSPSPLDDKNATITLDSADINSMKTQGHYFVRNLANSPIAGWVYVDVTGNNNDRLKQEVYQDNGYEHRSRRWTGSSWTEWTTDVNNKNVVSQINITPDQIKIASNKIVIDGNTDIHGDLRTDRVRLVGKNGAIDMTGDTGIKLTNNDGSSMLLGRGNIDLTYKNDFRMNIDSSMITLMHRNINISQGSPIAIGNIGAMYKTGNNKRRGLSIRYNPGGDNEQLHGADFLDIGFNDPNKLGNIINQLEFTSKDMQLGETRKRKGINFLDNINLQGYQIINVGDNDQESDGRWSNDPLMIHRSQWDKSSQSNRYQPTIRLGYDPNNKASAGVTFLWDQVKPFGNRDISDLGEIWFNGIKFIFGWVNNPDMMSNQWQPSFYRVADDGSITSGIAFAPGSTWDLGSNQAHNITAKLMWG